MNVKFPFSLTFRYINLLLFENIPPARAIAAFEGCTACGKFYSDSSNCDSQYLPRPETSWLDYTFLN